ncbi:hypothetical protein [Clostridium novyi]|uniref:hypothetical protein n=1 Tax=Clostridium novyi TaxID=1542 RepID=UPI0004DACF61|nr:hypothetical protein [Clostridium novyi]KEI08010.1 hypothetical protein Z958_p0085 [Clostridium novyi B str. NCTC 9691]KEI12746.1 signal peptidase II [Clostridium novyi B str. NCTC 9691]
MSEFFNVSLQKDVILDDSQIKNDMTWSSEKILKEIVSKRLTRFEQLKDVDVTNKKDKQIVAYSADTDKFTTVDAETVGSGGGNKLDQVCKMGVVGTPDKPHIVKIPINTTDFKVPRVNVLQYEVGEKDIIITQNTFSNAEHTDFLTDEMILFDDKAHLKTEHDYKYNFINEDDKYIYDSTTIDLDKFKHIEDLTDIEDGVVKKLQVTAIPKDRLLIPKKDFNLSYAEHVDYFKLVASGKNLKIIISADGGVTWKTFKNEKWIDIDLNVKEVEKNGITTEVFNKINESFWNELITNKKVRFAYLFKMDDIRDVEELDDLKLQYDGVGMWMQVPETLYKVVYSSNTILQVYIKFSGDIKINY